VFNSSFKSLKATIFMKMADWRQLLLHNVPRFGACIKSRGGVSEEEWEWLTNEESDTHYPAEVLIRADEFLLYPKDEPTRQHGLFCLILSLAIMAFVPGGVRIFDLHFDAKSENFLGQDLEDFSSDGKET
jgi:hypothetical protein